MINQVNIGLWFDTLEDLEIYEAQQLSFLLERGFNLEDAVERYDEVCIFHGRAEDYAQELVEETTEIPENLRYYIDYEAIARDMKINGEIEKIEHELIVTNGYDF